MRGGDGHKRKIGTLSGSTTSGGRWGNVPAERTRIMRANKRRDTRPERLVRSALHASGRRFRVDLPVRLSSGRSVRPDVVFTKQRVVVFIDGCFWHGCPEHGTSPRTNVAYWGPKIAANRARDRRNTAELEADGWTVIRAWEHEDPVVVADRVCAVCS